MDSREAITKELLAGAAPYGLSKKYPRATVYRIYNELLQSGQLPEPGTIVIDEGGNEPQPFIPATPTPSSSAVAVEEGKKGVGAETVELGPKTLPINAVERIRGILGITLRPKVLSCPMPELLYPAMVIACTELGFKPMRPDDFIDTVLYQWLEACDYIPYAYMKKSEMEEFAKKYGIADVEDVDKLKEKHGLMTAEEFARKFGITIEEVEEEPPPGEEEEVAKSAVEEIKETIAEIQQEVKDKAKEAGVEPHKPTVGDLLKCLHIDNIQKEVEKNGSAGCAKPFSS